MGNESKIKGIVLATFVLLSFLACNRSKLNVQPLSKIKSEQIISLRDSEVTTSEFSRDGELVSISSVNPNQKIILKYQDGDLKSETFETLSDTSTIIYVNEISSPSYCAGKILSDTALLGRFQYFSHDSVCVKSFYDENFECTNWNYCLYNNNFPNVEMVFNCNGDTLNKHIYQYSSRGEIMFLKSYDYTLRILHTDTFVNGLRITNAIQTLTGDTIYRDTAKVIREYW